MRPAAYDITYEFASVMLANPLVWMEMSNLTDKQIASLQKLISVYREIRKDFFNAEIYPIGECPDGFSYTGFQIVTGEKTGFLLLFRENDYVVKHLYALGVPLSKKVHVILLATNAPSKARLKLDVGGDVFALWECNRKHTFALYRYEG